MSELEPTRTYSNHTATEILRRMLDERGVEWEDGGEGLTIIPAQDGVPRAWEVNTWPSGKDMGDCLWVQNCHPLTPAQVIAATLGATDARPTQVESSGTCTDAEHQKALDEWKAEHGQMWLKGYAECHAELLEGNETLASDLEGCGWIRLPKDADGEYIHVGDEMCGYGWPNGGVYCRAIVNKVTILVGPQDGAYRGWLMWAANECRLHHAPTVEDVLREFASDIADVLGGDDFRLDDSDELFAEYAAKLWLAEREDA